MELSEWLEANRCHSVEPVRVRIGKTTYEGCRYKQTLRSLGEAAGLEPYMNEALYLIGPLPAVYRRSRFVAFTIEGDDREWFVASWVTTRAATDETTARFHFEGNEAVILNPWTAPGKIDDGERRQYDRVAIEVNAA